jgi:hypothetical protein
LWRFFGEPVTIFYKILLSGEWLTNFFKIFSQNIGNLTNFIPEKGKLINGQDFTYPQVTQQNVSLTSLTRDLILPYFKGCVEVNIFAKSTCSLEYNYFLLNNLTSYLRSLLSTPWNLDQTHLFQTLVSFNPKKSLNSTSNPNSYALSYRTTSTEVVSESVNSKYNVQEKVSDYRNLRLQNPIFKYDFKLGNYMSEETKRKCLIFIQLYMTLLQAYVSHFGRTLRKL